MTEVKKDKSFTIYLYTIRLYKKFTGDDDEHFKVKNS